MQITNTSNDQPRGLPNGQVLEPGESAEFKGDWEAVKGHPVVAHWLETGGLKIEGDEPAKLPPLKAPK